ncbi:MAG: tetratricopeptide repeat protein [Calditrichaceae bacterium]|nr:tetratricopeptide repeat protein [Calditrichaceae bacterium]
MKYFRILIISVFIIAFVSDLRSQERNRTVNLAQRLKSSGLYEEALPLYISIYKEGNRSFPVISGITECYENLKKYDELIIFLKELLLQYPDRINYSAEIGKIYFLKGDRNKAFEIWDELYNSAPDNPTVYIMIGNMMTQLRLYDDAITIYKKGLENTGRQIQFYRDIAVLYRLQMNYEQAVIYYFSLYQADPKQYAFVRQHIISMAKDEDAVSKILSGIMIYEQNNAIDDNIAELRAEMYIRNKDFKQAYAIYKELNANRPDNRFLLRFAEEAAANHAFDFAITAYNDVIRNLKSNETKITLQYYISRTHVDHGFWLRAKNRAEDADREILIALQLLNDISVDPLDTIDKWNALKLKADVYHKYYRNLDKAIEIYTRLIQAPAAAVSIDEVFYKLGLIYLENNQLNEAEKYFSKVIGRTYRNISKYQKAEILYYQGQFSNAENMLEELIRKTTPDDSLMNNLLSLCSFIKQNKSDSLILAKYSKAELLNRQKKKIESADIFSNITAGKSALFKDAAFQAAKIYMEIGELVRAESILANLIDYDTPIPEMDFAYYLLGDIYQRQNHLEKALEAFQVVLNFPSSFYMERARVRAREITGLLKEVQ